MLLDLDINEYRKMHQALTHYRYYVAEKLNDCERSFYPEMRNSIPNLKIEIQELDNLISKLVQIKKRTGSAEINLADLIAQIGEKTESMERWICSIFINQLDSEEFRAAVMSVFNDYKQLLFSNGLLQEGLIDLYVWPRGSDENKRLHAFFEWTKQEILNIQEREKEHPEYEGWWARKNQMLIVQQTLFNLMSQDIYPTDSHDLAYAKHVLWLLTNRKRQLVERIEKCDDAAALKQMKSTLSSYKRNITKAKKHLYGLLLKENSE